MKKISHPLSTIILCCLLSQTLISNVFAQSNEDLDGLVKDTKNDLLTVVGGGLAGAVLGLSTLSFVEEPKDHTNNIVVGASLGIIAGVAYVAFSQANRTQDMLYSGEEQASASQFSTRERKLWHQDAKGSKISMKSVDQIPTFAVSFRY